MLPAGGRPVRAVHGRRAHGVRVRLEHGQGGRARHRGGIPRPLRPDDLPRGPVPQLPQLAEEQVPPAVRRHLRPAQVRPEPGTGGREVGERAPRGLHGPRDRSRAGGDAGREPREEHRVREVGPAVPRREHLPAVVRARGDVEVARQRPLHAGTVEVGQVRGMRREREEHAQRRQVQDPGVQVRPGGELQHGRAQGERRR
mmetsp:Transcript_20150/g.43194  ORF Transcript_20150/g.43194 Transcript_20150/m.43194 type:complete len:200 (-) Transcript_20150:290-889(-)